MWPATTEWKRKVLELMEQLGISRAELSRRINVSDAAITVLFRETTATSRLVPAVNSVVGLAPPMMLPVDSDAMRERLNAVWPRLSEDDRKLLLETAVKFSQRKK